MAVHNVKAGDDWQFETTLTDEDGNAITSLADAWLSIYTDQDTEILFYELADAEMTLSSNVLTTIIPDTATTSVATNTYYLDVKVDVTGGNVQTVTYRDRVKCRNDSPLYDNF